MKKKGVSGAVCDLSSYPVQAPCAKCSHQDQGPVSGEGGLCVLCSTVLRIQEEVLEKARAGSRMLSSSSGAKGAEERPGAPLCRPVTWVLRFGGKGPPVVAKWSPGDLPFTLYRLFRDQSSGRVCATPISPP
jgi:hypothetical protein